MLYDFNLRATFGEGFFLEMKLQMQLLSLLAALGRAYPLDGYLMFSSYVVFPTPNIGGMFLRTYPVQRERSNS